MTSSDCRRILFLSFKSLLDRNSGAAIELRTILEAFAQSGDSIAAMSFHCFDTGNDYRPDTRIAADVSDHNNIGRLFHFDEKGIRHYLQIGPSFDTMDIKQADFDRFVANSKMIIDEFAPTHLIFFGSNELIPILQFATSKGTELLLYAGTAAYNAERQPLFDIAEKIIVPSEFIANHYDARFGVKCITIPTALPFDLPCVDTEAKSDARKQGFITIINPAADKGGHVAFAIARFMPDLGNRFLAVESRATQRFWQDHNYDTAALQNLWWAPWQPKISTVLRQTSILLMPSLIEEAAGKVISEAMAYGVPTVAYDVGGIPQQLGGSGILIPLTANMKLHPIKKHYDIYPSQESITPWIVSIKALIEDKDTYQKASQTAILSAKRYELDSVLAEWNKILTA